MPRTLNPEAHALRRDAFVDVAQRLIQAKGYEQMSIQNVLDELDASRGAFYHYFDSKEALLEAVVERFADSAAASVAPIATDPGLPALEKLGRVFSGFARWDEERRELLLALLRVWFSDDNAIVREKYRNSMVRRVAPLLAAIVRQGRAEGLVTASSPDHVARVLAALIQGFSDAGGELLVTRQANTVAFDVVERTVAAYTEAFERILGLPAGSLTIVDGPTLRLWFG